MQRQTLPDIMPPSARQRNEPVIRPIEQARGSHAEAARSLGLHPNNLHRLIRNLNLKAALGK